MESYPPFLELGPRKVFPFLVSLHAHAHKTCRAILELTSVIIIIIKNILSLVSIQALSPCTEKKVVFSRGGTACEQCYSAPIIS